MNLYCCFTPAHEILFRTYFLPSVPPSFSVTSFPLAIPGAGDFLSREFIECIQQKVDLILASIDRNAGEVIVWSDIDIQFFDVRPERLVAELGENDIAFQREGRRDLAVNTGFFACRCNGRTARFFERVKTGLIQNPAANEQAVINRLLPDSLDLTWTHLPFSYYARTQGWPPPRELSLYHANATIGADGVQRKIRQFRELAFLRRVGLPALILTSIKYAPKRIWRLLRGG